MIELRTLSCDDWCVWRSLRLAALGEAPTAFGSKLADWQGERDQEPRWRARLADVPFNVVAQLHATPVGMVSGAPNHGGVVELLSMWVAPAARGRGVGNRLLDAVCAWAAQQGAGSVRLRVYTSNTHARALYARNHFALTQLIKARSAGREDEWEMWRAL